MHKRLFLIAIIVTTLFSSCTLFSPSAGKLYKKALAKHNQYDAVIVPGVPFNEPKWDNVMMMRVTWAVHLYKKGLTKNIIMSGSSVYSPYVEGAIMKRYAVALGVPEENVIIEGRAEHSTENVWYGFHLAKAKGFDAIALATDPFQTKMVYRFGKKRTKGISFLPVIFDTLKDLPHDTPEISYTDLKIENFIPITERESWRKRFRGTRGKNINYKEIPSEKMVNNDATNVGQTGHVN